MAFRNFIYSTTETALTKAITAKTVTNDDIAFVNENGVMFIQTQGVKFPFGYSKSEADSRYLKLTGGYMSGDIRFSGEGLYTQRWLINFASYSSISFSSTDTIQYDNYTSNRITVNSTTTHFYGPDTWIISTGTSNKMHTYANGSRPLFVRNENHNKPRKGDRVVIVGTAITQTSIVDTSKTPSSVQVTSNTSSSGVITEIVQFTTTPTTDIPIFLNKGCYIQSISYTAVRNCVTSIYYAPGSITAGSIYGSVDSNNDYRLNIYSNYGMNVYGATTFNSSVTASSLKKSGSSDSYFLLGGGGTTAISNYSKASHTHTSLEQKYATDGTLGANSSVLTALYAVGSNKYANNPEPNNGFGVIKLRTAEGYYGDIMLTHVGNLYTRSSNVLNGAAWRRVIDSKGGTIDGNLSVNNTLTVNKSNFTDTIGAASGIRCGVESDADNLTIDGNGRLTWKNGGTSNYANLYATGFTSGTMPDRFDLLNDSLTLNASFGDSSKYWSATYGVDGIVFDESTKSSSSSSSYDENYHLTLTPENSSTISVTGSGYPLLINNAIDGGYAGYEEGSLIENYDYIPAYSFKVDALGYVAFGRRGSGSSTRAVEIARFDQYQATVGMDVDPSNSSTILSDYGFGFFGEYPNSDSFVGLTPTGVKLYGGSSSKILVSDGTMNTLKTVNGESVLGSGDVSHTFHFDAYNTTVTPTIATSIPTTATNITTGGVTFYTKVNKFLVSVSYTNNNTGYNALFNLKNGYPVNNLGFILAGTQRVASKYPHNMYAKYPDVYICTGTSITYYCNGSGSSAAALVQTQLPSVPKLSTTRTVSGGVDIVTSFTYDGSANSTMSIGYNRGQHRNTTTNNYPWHRIAYVDVIKNAYIDKTSILRIYDGKVYGRFALIHIGLRTNSNVSTGAVSSATAKWIISDGFDTDSIKIGLYNVGSATYADVFMKTPSATTTLTVDFISNMNQLTTQRTWIAVNSLEAADTTDTNKKASTECWKTIEEAATELHGQAYTNIISAEYWPKTLTTSGISDGVNNITTTGSGNAITAVSVSGHKLTATKGTSFLPSTGGTLSGNLTVASGKQIIFAGSGGSMDAGTTNPGDISINGGCVIDLDGWVNTPCVHLGDSSLDGDIQVWYNGKQYQLNFAKLLSLGCLTAME